MRCLVHGNLTEVPPEAFTAEWPDAQKLYENIAQELKCDPVGPCRAALSHMEVFGEVERELVVCANRMELDAQLVKRLQKEMNAFGSGVSTFLRMVGGVSDFAAHRG